MAEATVRKVYSAEELTYQDLNDDNADHVARDNERLEKSDVVVTAAPNKVPRANTEGKLQFDITGNAATSDHAVLADTAEVAETATFAAGLNDGVVATKLTIVTGTIMDAGTIPPPTGFLISDCKIIVSLNASLTSAVTYDVDENHSHPYFDMACYVEPTTGKVTCYTTEYDQFAGLIRTASRANYLLMVVK